MKLQIFPQILISFYIFKTFRSLPMRNKMVSSYIYFYFFVMKFVFLFISMHYDNWYPLNKCYYTMSCHIWGGKIRGDGDFRIYIKKIIINACGSPLPFPIWEVQLRASCILDQHSTVGSCKWTSLFFPCSGGEQTLHILCFVVVVLFLYSFQLKHPYLVPILSPHLNYSLSVSDV